MEEESWTTGHFDATLLSGSLRVGHVPASRLTHCTHALVKLLVQDAEDLDSSNLYDGLGGSSPTESSRFGAAVPASSSISQGVRGVRGDTAASPAEDVMANDETMPFLGLDGFVDEEQNGAVECGVNIMLIQDMDGVTVIVNERYYRHLKLTGATEHMDWAPVPWRALNIHLGPASADAPGIISYLSSMLSERNVSILNFSTFEADLILVQEFDLTKARELLFELGRDGVTGLKEQIAEKSEAVSNGASGVGGSGKNSQNNGSHNIGGKQPHRSSSVSPSMRFQQHMRGKTNGGKTRSSSVSSEATHKAALNVVQSPLVLACVQRAMLKQTMFSLMKQLSRNIDVQLSLESETTKHNGGAASGQASYTSTMSKDYLWAYFSTNEEVSMLLDERDLKDFPEDSLVVCPQRWKAIRLVGTTIPFEETGVVRLMSSPYESGIQLLNMSTYRTNVTLVVENEVQTAIDRLRMELKGNETVVYGTYYSRDDHHGVKPPSAVSYKRDIKNPNTAIFKPYVPKTDLLIR